MESFTAYKQSHVDISKLYTDPTFLDQNVTVCGWIRTFRLQGKKGRFLGFVKLYDGTSHDDLQIVFVQQSLPTELKDKFDDLFSRAKTGASLTVTGKLIKSIGQGQTVELQASDYKVFGDVHDPGTYPIAKTELSIVNLRTLPDLRVRTQLFRAVNKIRSVMKFAFAEYFDSIGFFEVQIPLITDNECESGACPFTVTTVLGDGKASSIPLKDDKTVDFHEDFFRKRAYLTVSGQLHLEALISAGLQKAWCMTTAFRAEKSLTRFHAAEFWMIELEFCFSTLLDNMKVNEGALKHCFKKVLERCYPELEFFQKEFKPDLIARLQKYASKPFVISTHEECVKLMLQDELDGKVKFNSSPKLDDDISREHERYITEVLFDGTPVFVRHFPAKVKSFYMPKIDSGSPIEHVDGFDLLMEGVEIVGGSQRESDYEKLIARMHEMGVDPESMKFYSRLRQYGTVPHGGSGIGFDRVLMACTGLDDVRDAIPFPRCYQECRY